MMGQAGGGRQTPAYVEGPGDARAGACALFNLTPSAKRVPKAAACSAGTAPTPTEASAASTAALDAPQASSAQARLLAPASMRLRVVSDMPYARLTSAFDERLRVVSDMPYARLTSAFDDNGAFRSAVLTTEDANAMSSFRRRSTC